MSKDLNDVFSGLCQEEYKDGLCIDCWIELNGDTLEKIKATIIC